MGKSAPRLAQKGKWLKRVTWLGRDDESSVFLFPSIDVIISRKFLIEVEAFRKKRENEKG